MKKISSCSMHWQAFLSLFVSLLVMGLAGIIICGGSYGFYQALNSLVSTPDGLALAAGMVCWFVPFLAIVIPCPVFLQWSHEYIHVRYLYPRFATCIPAVFLLE